MGTASLVNEAEGTPPGAGVRSSSPSGSPWVGSPCSAGMDILSMLSIFLVFSSQKQMSILDTLSILDILIRLSSLLASVIIQQRDPVRSRRDTQIWNSSHPANHRIGPPAIHRQSNPGSRDRTPARHTGSARQAAGYVKEFPWSVPIFQTFGNKFGKTRDARSQLIK